MEWQITGVKNINRKRAWKEHLKKLINEENDWDQLINVNVW